MTVVWNLGGIIGPLLFAIGYSDEDGYRCILSLILHPHSHTHARRYGLIAITIPVALVAVGMPLLGCYVKTVERRNKREQLVTAAATQYSKLEA